MLVSVVEIKSFHILNYFYNNIELKEYFDLILILFLIVC